MWFSQKSMKNPCKCFPWESRYTCSEHIQWQHLPTKTLNQWPFEAHWTGSYIALLLWWYVLVDGKHAILSTNYMEVALVSHGFPAGTLMMWQLCPETSFCGAGSAEMAAALDMVEGLGCCCPAHPAVLWAERGNWCLHGKCRGQPPCMVSGRPPVQRRMVRRIEKAGS